MTKIARKIAIDLAPPIDADTATEIPDVAKATDMVDAILAPTLALMDRLVERLDERITECECDTPEPICDRCLVDGTFLADYANHLKEQG